MSNTILTIEEHGDVTTYTVSGKLFEDGYGYNDLFGWVLPPDPFIAADWFDDHIIRSEN